MDKRVTDYLLAKDGTLSGLEQAVQNLIDEGWEPIGGPGYNGRLHYQALVFRGLP